MTSLTSATVNKTNGFMPVIGSISAFVSLLLVGAVGFSVMMVM